MSIEFTHFRILFTNCRTLFTHFRILFTNCRTGSFVSAYKAKGCGEEKRAIRYIKILKESLKWQGVVKTPPCHFNKIE